MVVLPMLRPLRLLRLVTLLAIVHRSSGQSLRGRVVIYATGATALLIGGRGAGHARCRASRAGRCHHVVRNGIVVGDGDGHDRRLRRHGARYHDRAHDRRSIDDRRNCVAGHRDCHTSLPGWSSAWRNRTRHPRPRRVSRWRTCPRKSEPWPPARTESISRPSIPIRCVANWRRGESWRSMHLRTIDPQYSKTIERWSDNLA